MASAAGTPRVCTIFPQAFAQADQRSSEAVHVWPNRSKAAPTGFAAAAPARDWSIALGAIWALGAAIGVLSMLAQLLRLSQIGARARPAMLDRRNIGAYHGCQ